MSYELSLDFGALISGFSTLINSVITGISSALPVIGTAVTALGVIGLMFAVMQRVPIVGEFVGRIVETIRGVF